MKKICVLIFFVTISCFLDAKQKVTSCLSLCAEFWDLDKPTPPAAEYALFRHYVAKASGPVLEPMCGSGRYLIALLEEGFTVDGFDASPFMIQALRTKCTQKNLSPQVKEQFFDAVSTKKKYDLIFIPDTSLCFFTDLQDVRKSLQKVYSLLRPGGIFVFDVQTTYSRWGQIGLWMGAAHKNAKGNTLIESALPLPIVNSVSPLLLRYELMVDNAVVKTEVEYYSARLYRPHEMDDLLGEVGFKKIKKMKAYDYKQSPSGEDAVVVYECIK